MIFDSLVPKRKSAMARSLGLFKPGGLEEGVGREEQIFRGTVEIVSRRKKQKLNCALYVRSLNS